MIRFWEREVWTQALGRQKAGQTCLPLATLLPSPGQGFCFLGLGPNFPPWSFSLPTRKAPRLWGPRPSAVHPLCRWVGERKGGSGAPLSSREQAAVSQDKDFTRFLCFFLSTGSGLPGDVGVAKSNRKNLSGCFRLKALL